MADPLNGVYKTRQSPLHRSRRSRAADCVGRIPRPNAGGVYQDGWMPPAWFLGGLHPGKVCSIGASPGKALAVLVLPAIGRGST